MASYDPSIIQQHAGRLYSRADAIVAAYGLGFTVIGLLGGSMLATVLDGPGLVIVALGGLFCALLGIALGRARGFELRLQAQIALCQVQIELNTRQHAAVAQPPIHHPPQHAAQYSHQSPPHV